MYDYTFVNAEISLRGSSCRSKRGLPVANVHAISPLVRACPWARVRPVFAWQGAVCQCVTA
eukprot:537313-Pleurochrysis_carterae.AAC.4